MINIERNKQLEANCYCKQQLTRIGYGLQPLKESENYFSRFTEGTAIFNRNDVLLLSNHITCLAEFGNAESKLELLTNDTDYADMDSIRLDSIKGIKPNNFIYSLIDLLKYKTLSLNQRLSEQKQNNEENGKLAVLTLLLNDDSILELDFSNELHCTHDSIAITEEEMFLFIPNVVKITKLHTKTISPKGTREMILTNNFAEILKELFYFVNRTLILDYNVMSSLKRCILFDKQVLEIQENGRRGISLTSYSINKFNYDFPDAILCTSDSFRDINTRITEYAEKFLIPLDRKRR